MGKGPALALLLAGPSLSLPNMLVIQGVMGTKKQLFYFAGYCDGYDFPVFFSGTFFKNFKL